MPNLDWAFLYLLKKFWLEGVEETFESFLVIVSYLELLKSELTLRMF